MVIKRKKTNPCQNLLKNHFYKRNDINTPESMNISQFKKYLKNMKSAKVFVFKRLDSSLQRSGPL